MSDKLRIRVGTRVPQELAERFAELAGEEERSVSALLRLLMRRHVDEQNRRAAEPPAAISPGQLAALHAKANDLARLTGQERAETKQAALEAAAEEFGRPIESSRDLSFDEAHFTLDWLEDQIKEARAK